MWWWWDGLDGCKVKRVCVKAGGKKENPLYVGDATIHVTSGDEGDKKVDFFALLYIVKKERIVYNIEILFWIKNVYKYEEFC